MPTFKTNTSTLVLLILFCLASRLRTQSLSPIKKLPMQTVTLQVAPRFQDKVSGTHTLSVPRGYKASVFYAGRLSKGRFMCWGPDSTLCIANMSSGEVLALPDKDRDLVADTAIVAVRDAYGHDVKFFRGSLYVACETRVEKFDDNDKDGVYETRSVFIDSVLKGNKRPPGGHTTRTIVFDPPNNRLYLSVGSSCNICREESRAVIFAYDLEGRNRRLYATGTRNCIGMALHPRTGQLWATNNGSDFLGDDTPPEWVNSIKEGSFYGYPFAYGNRQYFNFQAHDDYRKILPITREDSAKVKRMEIVTGNIRAHAAPMAIEFSNPSFGKQLGSGAFVACRGSFDVKTARGYHVLFIKDDGKKVTGVSELITGFLPTDGRPWARPVGVLPDQRGHLFVSSDDEVQFILVLSPAQ
jgi:glucose/arabinose dehydrogenase